MSNSLASVHPELIPKWSEKNLPLTPDKITFGSNKRVWWKGACGHEWETSVKARSKGEKCPICSGARVIEGINDLATLKPLLAQEWSEKNELKPTEVSVASHKKIIWKCKHGHEWEASVKSRTVNGTGCPYTMQRLQSENLNALQKTRIIVTEPKSYAALRTIPLPEFVIDVIKPFAGSPNTYVLSGECKKIIEPRIMQNRFKAYLAEGKIEEARSLCIRVCNAYA